MTLTGDAKREYQREWLRKRREDYFRGKTCLSCDSPDNLELDHVDPTQKVSHRIWSWSKEKREEELAKCQPLCYDCHKNKTSDFIDRDICTNGHDKREVGRDQGNSCSECRRQKDRRYRKLGIKK